MMARKGLRQGKAHKRPVDGLKVSEIRKFHSGLGGSDRAGVCTTAVFLTDKVKPIYWHAYPKHVNLARKDVDAGSAEVRKWFRDEPKAWRDESEQEKLMQKLRGGLEKGELIDRSLVERIRPENIIRTIMQHINEEEPNARVKIHVLPGERTLDKESNGYEESMRAYYKLLGLARAYDSNGRHMVKAHHEGGHRTFYNDKEGNVYWA